MAIDAAEPVWCIFRNHEEVALRYRHGRASHDRVASEVLSIRLNCVHQLTARDKYPTTIDYVKEFVFMNVYGGRTDRRTVFEISAIGGKTQQCF